MFRRFATTAGHNAMRQIVRKNGWIRAACGIRQGGVKPVAEAVAVGGCMRQVSTSLDQLVNLDLSVPHARERKTKIVCTIGPSTWTREGVDALLDAGMNVARMNFSHGTYEQKEDIINIVREAVSENQGNVDFTDGSMEDVCAIALDTKGPEIRTGLYAASVGSHEITLSRGDKVRLSMDPADREHCTADKIFLDYPTFHEEIDVGQVVYVDDGLISLTVTECGDGWVDAVVDNGGSLGESKGVNLPGASLNLPSLTEQDRQDLAFGACQGIDMVFASFIRNAHDVQAIRDALVAGDADLGRRVMVISKIENWEGVERFDEILAASDGVMVARGDLGIEIPPEKVFLAQKMMLAKCLLVGKASICATQMLESMVNNPRPTRAEVNDVANAVHDGADAVMLSGETAKGKYPSEAVQIMGKVCQEAESATDYRAMYDGIHKRYRSMEESLLQYGHDMNITRDAIARSAVAAAASVDAKAIIVFCREGGTARDVARFRPSQPVVALAEDHWVARHLNLSRGVFPFVTDTSKFRGALRAAIDFTLQLGLTEEGDRVAIVSSDKLTGDPSVTIRTVGSSVL